MIDWYIVQFDNSFLDKLFLMLFVASDEYWLFCTILPDDIMDMHALWAVDANCDDVASTFDNMGQKSEGIFEDIIRRCIVADNIMLLTNKGW